MIVFLAGSAPAALAADTAAKPAARPAPASRPAPAAPRPARSASRPKTASTALGGPAKYDAKKGAMLGGTVMPHKP
jgi:hypothetical protein